MKIEDVSQLFDFLGGLGFFSFLALAVVLAIVTFVLIAPYKEGNNITHTRALLIVLVVILAFTALYIDAKVGKDDTTLANYVKQYMANNNLSETDFTTIPLPGHFKGKDACDLFKMLTEKFPEQFARGQKPLDSHIVLLDVKAVSKIDSTMSTRAERISSLLAGIMTNEKIDIIYTNYDPGKKNEICFQKIDNQGWLLGQLFFKMLVGRNNIYPVYDINWNIIGFKQSKSVKK